MAVAFYNPISDDFHIKLCNSTTFDEQVDACTQYIHEFLSIIQNFYGIHKCNLGRCQVRLYFESLEIYSKNLRKSNRHLRKNFVQISQKYPEGFKDCVALA